MAREDPRSTSASPNRPLRTARASSAQTGSAIKELDHQPIVAGVSTGPSGPTPSLPATTQRRYPRNAATRRRLAAADGVCLTRRHDKVGRREQTSYTDGVP